MLNIQQAWANSSSKGRVAAGCLFQPTESTVWPISRLKTENSWLNESSLLCCCLFGKSKKKKKKSSHMELCGIAWPGLICRVQGAPETHRETHTETHTALVLVGCCWMWYTHQRAAVSLFPRSFLFTVSAWHNISEVLTGLHAECCMQRLEALQSQWCYIT